jgi:hypothetical protein
MQLRWGIVLVGVMLLGTAMAGEELRPNGHTLLRACTAALRGMEHPLHDFPSSQAAYYEGYCLGVIGGITSLSPHLTLSPSLTYCLPYQRQGDTLVTLPSRGQLVGVVQRYLQAHPERLQSPDFALVLEAFHTAFPCPPSPAQPPR